MKIKGFFNRILCKHIYKVVKRECEDDVTVRVCSKCGERQVHHHKWAYLR